MTQPVLTIENLCKAFHLHLQNDTHIHVFDNLNLTVKSGECTVLNGVSGMGKSSLLKCIYGNYVTSDAEQHSSAKTKGKILVHFADGDIDLVTCTPQVTHAIRKNTIAYVSQFLRVVPRVPAITVVAQPLIDDGVATSEAESKAEHLLERLHIPSHLWKLSPTSFSGGEQQRINIARSFIKHYPIMLLDEPTASLDAKNRAVVLDLINEAKAKGSGMIGIFHDEETRTQVADYYLNLADFVKQ